MNKTVKVSNLYSPVSALSVNFGRSIGEMTEDNQALVYQVVKSSLLMTRQKLEVGIPGEESAEQKHEELPSMVKNSVVKVSNLGTLSTALSVNPVRSAGEAGQEQDVEITGDDSARQELANETDDRFTGEEAAKLELALMQNYTLKIRQAPGAGVSGEDAARQVLASTGENETSFKVGGTHSKLSVLAVVTPRYNDEGVAIQAGTEVETVNRKEDDLQAILGRNVANKELQSQEADKIARPSTAGGGTSGMGGARISKKEEKIT